MSFVNTCRIVLNSQSGEGVFFSGQLMTGSVTFTLNKPKNVKGLFIELKGSARVQWIEYRGSGSQRKSINFSGKQDYFKTSSLLVTATDGSDTIELSEGEHRYDFAFELPHGVPSSFEGQYGYIRYSAKAIMDQPWKLNKQHKLAFTVLSTVDLNTDPMHATPITHKLQKTNTSLFGKSGTLFMDVLMPGNGFVPGQAIPIKLAINNESKASVDGFLVHLTQISSYVAHSPWEGIRLVKNKISVVQVPDVVEGQTVREILVSLDIPSSPPTSLLTNNIISIAYYLKVTAQVSGMHRNLDGKFSIIIGTVPFFMEHYTSHQPTASFAVQPHPNYQHPHPEQSSSEQFLPSAPPPSYEECTRSTELVCDDDDDSTYEQGYKPKYPVYMLPPK